MELIPGSRIGRYEILGPLGAGGMGRVLQARDLNLGRRVAVKVLHDATASDPSWLARFDREARLLATITHPGIATVHGLDESDGLRYIVMELVPGQTLARRLIGGALPIDEAIEVGRQIAEALEAAHDQGIIHRDLKPANVMLTPEGRVKVLDFGLARSTQPTNAHAGSGGQSEDQTEVGVILGTPAYMAPEQARGLVVDRRCDIWAIGCILFEALAGRPVFGGRTVHDTLATVIEGSPDWNSLPAGTPPRVADLLRRCLRKDPHKRLRDAGDVRLELEESLAELAGAPKSSARKFEARLAAGTAWTRARRWRPVLAAALVALTAFAMVRRGQQPTVAMPAPPAKARPPTAWSGQFLLQVEAATYAPRVSPDGKWLAFVVVHEGQAQVGVMRLDSGEWWVLTRNRDRGQVKSVCWTLDSTRVFFDRSLGAPAGVYSASPLDRAPEGAREIPAVAGAACPQVMADGSLLVVKRGPAGDHQLCRFIPGQAVRPVGPRVEFERGWTDPVRALHKANKVVFCGRVLDGKASPGRRFHLLDLDTGELRTIGDEDVGVEFVPLAISWGDDYLYTVCGHDDTFHIARVPLAGRSAPEPLLTLTTSIYGLDVDPEGRLYVDQFQRPMVVLRFDPEADGHAPDAAIPAERLTEPMLWRETATVALPLELPDGRLLMPTKAAGRDRLVSALLGKTRVPLFPDNPEETALPAALVGKDRLAYTSGSGDGRRLRLASLEGGGARVEPTDLGIQGRRPSSLASTPDGKTLYFARARRIYEVPADGSRPPREVEAGDAVAVEPRTGALLVQRFDGSGTRLYRLPMPAGRLQEVPIRPGALRLAPVTLAGAAAHPDGRVLVTIASPDSCHWQTAVLGPGGDLRALPVDFHGDVIPAAWSKGGKVLAMGFANSSDLWRFTPARPEGRAGEVVDAE